MWNRSYYQRWLIQNSLKLRLLLPKEAEVARRRMRQQANHPQKTPEVFRHLSIRLSTISWTSCPDSIVIHTADSTKMKFHWDYYKQLSEHSSFEMQLSHWDSTSFFDVNLKWTLKGDHCGPLFSIEVLGWFFDIQVYDHRHWNYDADRFYFPGEEWSEVMKLEKEESDKTFVVEVKHKL